MTRYNIHLYREMRLHFVGIDADGPDEAAAVAARRATDEADDIQDCEGQNHAALVDVEGDDDYEHSVTIEFEGERRRKAASALLASLVAVLPYAQSEAYCLEKLKDSPEATAEADRAWQAIEAAEAATTAAKAARLIPDGINAHDACRQITEVWSVLDVRSVRPDLTDAQACAVLESVCRTYDPAVGITWDVLRRHAQGLFRDAAATPS